MSKEGELPPLAAYSFDGILGSIREVVEEDLNGIAEILGQSRLVLANQHDSHLPPTGEIRAAQLPALAGARTSNERHAGDDVLILNENASLVEGSQAGSAAYGLLERLQAAPRTRRVHSELATSPIRPRFPLTEAHHSSPAMFTEFTNPSDPHHQIPVISPASPPQHRPSQHLLLRLTSSATATALPAPTAAAASSETWLSAGADGHVVSDPPIVSEAGRNYPLYSYDESQLFETPDPPSSSIGLSFAARVQRLVLLRDVQGALAWTSRRRGEGQDGRSGGGGAEEQLRGILGKHPSPQPAGGGAGGGATAAASSAGCVEDGREGQAEEEEEFGNAPMRRCGTGTVKLGSQRTCTNNDATSDELQDENI